MNIQFVRLELDVCEKLNEMAHEQRRTVSDLVNEMLRRQIALLEGFPTGETASF